jgi:5-methyltetrahydrofolate--homocysteine methyltransferase
VTFQESFAAGGTLVLDGAMGTELERRGALGGFACNLADPAAVRGVHRDYRAAGCRGMTTNTLTANGIFIRTHRLDIDVRAVNVAGARAARTVAGDAALVLGNLSSTGLLMEPYGELTEAAAVACFSEQALFLAAGEIDAFIIETMMDLREAVCALRACRAVSPLPVIACVSFHTVEHGGRTMMGDSARQCAARLEAEGAAAVGANCGSVDPLEMAEIVAEMGAATRLPLCAEPNAGRPRLEGARTVFDMDAETFGRGVMACAAAGARILGGCCGTTPAHLSALVEALGERRGGTSSPCS